MRLPPALAGPRGRPWLVALDVVLLVGVYLVLEFTYARTHLPPHFYDPLPAGASARLQGAEFRVLSLRQTEAWGRESDGTPASADPGATWVVAVVEVVPYLQQDFIGTDLTLVATDGSAWEPNSLGPIHEGESYLPDDYEVGTRYTVVKAYQVPLADADRVAGLARSLYNGDPWPLLRPGG